MREEKDRWQDAGGYKKEAEKPIDRGLKANFCFNVSTMMKMCTFIDL